MELTRYASPLGTIFLAADNGALAGLWLEEQKYFAATLDEAAVERDDLPVFRQAAAQTAAAMDAMALPELDYFREHFLPSYSLTLDELE